MALERHVLAEIGEQLEFYVDAYKKVKDCDVRLAALSEQMEAVGQERSDAERLRDEAQAALNALTENVAEADEDEVRALADEKLAPLVRLMVM